MRIITCESFVVNMFNKYSRKILGGVVKYMSK